MKKILFISHDATRSGAPFVLLYLLQWLKQNTSYQVDVLFLRPGPIKPEFEKVADHVYSIDNLVNPYALKNKLKRKLGYKESEDATFLEVGKKIDITSYSLVYGNTIVSLSWLLAIKRLFNVKVIIAIHELRTIIEDCYTPAFLEKNFPAIDLIIAGSGAVEKNLVEQYKAEPSRIAVVHAFIHTNVKVAADDKLLPSLGIQKDKFIIGCVGTPDLRKGLDLIVPLGLHFKKHYPSFNYHIIWVGGNHQDQFRQYIKSDVEKTNLSDSITLVEGTSAYLSYMNVFNVFAMLSREDPFPLVCLEAANLYKPIVMFDGAGGTSELLVNGGGMIVPYLDIEALAKAFVDIGTDDKLAVEMGHILHKEVSKNYSSDIACKKVLSILEKLL